MSAIGLMRGVTAAALVIAADQAVKVWALGQPYVPGGIEMAPGLRIVQAWNPGINFGLFGDAAPWQPWLLIGIAVAAAAALLAWTARIARQWHNFAAGAVAGGALSNAFDRLIFGAVHDYLNVSCCGIQNPYAFNLADTAIVAGALVLVLKR